jgi:hypothetical protein
MTTEELITTEKAALESLITEVRTAISGILTGAIESYEFDTGQNKTKVTKLNVQMLKNYYNSLLSQHQVMCLYTNGGGMTIGAPGW